MFDFRLCLILVRKDDDLRSIDFPSLFRCIRRRHSVVYGENPRVASGDDGPVLFGICSTRNDDLTAVNTRLYVTAVGS